MKAQAWHPYHILNRILAVSVFLGSLLVVSAFLGLSIGSTEQGMGKIIAVLTGHADQYPTLSTIIWRIRLPRVLLAALVGATLSLGGLVFQALLRNPLAEPYILGISGGSAVGAIIGLLMGLSPFPGVALLAFAGSMATLLLVLLVASTRYVLKKDALILSGVMVNAFCSSVIMFLISITRDSKVHSILFWLMGDLSTSDMSRAPMLLAVLPPCFGVLFLLARPMNILLMGEETAANMGVNVRLVSFVLLLVASFMVSIVVCQTGLLGFVGLVMPHLLRLLLGPDHRVLVPGCILGGSSFLILCDLLARSLPSQGEMPVGVITAMVGAPIFIILLLRSKR
jgi:iron complex transport system permease protein